jgi:hypothetical protein
VCYASVVTFKQDIDYLYCSPLFHGEKRYDAVLINAALGNFFARLVSMLTCTVDGEIYSICIVFRLDAPIGPRRPSDTELELYRLRSHRLPGGYEIVFARSIIRGALIVADRKKEGDFFIMDLVDTDMFSRCNRMFSG